MQKLIIILTLIISTLLISGCGLSEQDCRDIALKEAKNFEDVGILKGELKGVEICEDNYNQLLSQYKPRTDCFIIVWGDTLQQICKGSPYYENILSIRGK